MQYKINIIDYCIQNTKKHSHSANLYLG